MDFRIIAVGKVRERDLQSRIEDYAQRIRHDANLDIAEIRDSDIRTEGARILEIISKENSAFIFALGEEGRECGSVEFARKIASIPRKIIFIIGGHAGLDPSVKQYAHEIFALSRMTFTHEIARMLLMEQMYRSVSIINNRKYHRA